MPSLSSDHYCARGDPDEVCEVHDRGSKSAQQISTVPHSTMAASCDASYAEKRGYLLENLVFVQLKRQTYRTTADKLPPSSG